MNSGLGNMNHTQESKMQTHELGPFRDVQEVTNVIQVEYARSPRDGGLFAPHKYFLVTTVDGQTPQRRRLPTRVAQALMAEGFPYGD
jgi:hypothetical protein